MRLQFYVKLDTSFVLCIFGKTVLFFNSIKSVNLRRKVEFFRKIFRKLHNLFDTLHFALHVVKKYTFSKFSCIQFREQKNALPKHTFYFKLYTYTYMILGHLIRNVKMVCLSVHCLHASMYMYVCTCTLMHGDHLHIKVCSKLLNFLY